MGSASHEALPFGVLPMSQGNPVLRRHEPEPRSRTRSSGVAVGAAAPTASTEHRVPPGPGAQ